MSIHAMSWAIKVKGLPIATKAVLMMLADCHNGETGQCNPSIAYLQETTGLKERALQLHFKALEEAGLVHREYAFHGRGKGCSVEQYNLKIGIIGAVKKPKIDPQDFAPAKQCARKIRSMDPQNIAVAYKEEPEENRNNKPRNPVSEDFERAWKLYQSCPHKAGQTKKLARDQWPKAVKRAGGPEPILKAIEAVAAKQRNAEGFVENLPDMHRWLARDKWQDVLPPAEAEPAAEITIEDWQRAMRHWVDTGEWLADHVSPPPNDPGCTAPANMIRHALKLRPQGAAA